MCEYIELHRNEKEYMLLKVNELKEYCNETLGISYEGFLHGYTFDDVEFIEKCFPHLNHSKPCSECKNGRLYRQTIKEAKIYICDACPMVAIEGLPSDIEKTIDYFIHL